MYARLDHAERSRPGLSLRWLGLGFLFLTGCGLADYEAKMAEAQKRVHRAEKENEVLDKPLLMPTKTAENEETVIVGTVFIRPPRGINEVPDQNPRDGVFYVYRPRSELLAHPFSRMEIAFAPEEKDKDFGEMVFGHFQGRGRMNRGQRQIQLLGRSVVVDFADVEVPQGGLTSFISINIPRGCSRSVALIYYTLPGQKVAASKPVIDLSLEAFGCDADIAKQQTAYQQGQRWSKQR